MIDKSQLDPSQVVLDLVLRYSPRMPQMGEAAIMGDGLIFLTRNNRGEAVSMCVPINLDGEPRDGDDPRFVLCRLGPTVWKLSPSVLHPMLHAYITVVGVPETDRV